jgi:hypothetical protein
MPKKHGADYFRRGHRNRENSGSLLDHKATHHFDLVNWWLGTVPQSVHATGRRAFCRPETAQRYGLNRRTERCHGCAEADRCPFFLDITANLSLREQRRVTAEELLPGLGLPDYPPMPDPTGALPLS